MLKITWTYTKWPLIRLPVVKYQTQDQCLVFWKIYKKPNSLDFSRIDNFPELPSKNNDNMLCKPKNGKPKTKLIYEFWAFKSKRYAFKLKYKVPQGKNYEGINNGSLKNISVDGKNYCLLHQFTEEKR